MKRKTIYLGLIFLAAFFASSALSFASSTRSSQLDCIADQTVDHKNTDNLDTPDLAYSCIPFTFGSENLPRALEGPKNPFGGNQKITWFFYVEKFESTSAKVSLKHLSTCELRKCRKELLFLELRKILI